MHVDWWPSFSYAPPSDALSPWRWAGGRWARRTRQLEMAAGAVVEYHLALACCKIPRKDHELDADGFWVLCIQRGTMRTKQRRYASGVGRADDLVLFIFQMREYLKVLYANSAHEGQAI